MKQRDAYLIAFACICWVVCVLMGGVLILEYRPDPRLYLQDGLVIRSELSVLVDGHAWLGVMAVVSVWLAGVSNRGVSVRLVCTIVLLAGLLLWFWTGGVLVPGSFHSAGDPEGIGSSELMAVYIVHIAALPLLLTIFLVWRAVASYRSKRWRERDFREDDGSSGS